MTKSRRRLEPDRSQGAMGAWRLIAQIALIVIATFMAYLPALHGDFVWDDELLVTRNPLLHNWSGLGEIWAFGRTADYFPLTNSVFWIEWHLFGKVTAGYHLINIVLQIANALLLWRVLVLLRVPGAWLAGFIFAIHPVHAESVAWISELKNVFSMFWALVSVLLFLRFVDRRTEHPRTTYILSLTSFILALLAKTQTVFLPVALLLVIWWKDSVAAKPLKERQPPDRRTNPKPVRQRPEKSRLLVSLLPFFAVALVLGLVSVAFQNRGLGEEQVVIGGIGRRLANAGIAVWWYAGKLIAPIRLMPIYPSWRFDPPRFVDWLPLLALIVILGLFWRFRNRGTGGALVAVAGFILGLAPILGFLQMSFARSGTLVADHYQYFADTFLIALTGAGVAWLWAGWNIAGRSAIAIAIVVLLGGLSIYTRSRAQAYLNEETLWLNNLSHNPDAWQAHNRLGQFYFDRGRFNDAAPHLERAAALKPELADNHNQLGLVYCRLGRFEEGIAEYREALLMKDAKPSTARSAGVATMRTNLANALTITANDMIAADPARPDEANRRYQEAIAQYQEALTLEPMHPAIHRNLGMLLFRLGRYPEAIPHLRKVLEIVPNEPNALELLHLLEQRMPADSQ